MASISRDPSRDPLKTEYSSTSFAPTANTTVSTNRLESLSLRRPIQIPLVLLSLALTLRVLDIFVLRLDERLGEIILSKSLGFLVIIGYLWAMRRTVRDIGLHSGGLGQAVGVASLTYGLLFLIGFGIQLAILRANGANPMLVFTAIDPKTGMAGEWLFGVWLISGNLVNSFMEEGLFRGVMLRHFRVNLPFWRANLLQAALFAAWHLVWPVKSLVSGNADLAGAMTEGVMLVIATFISGSFYGYLYHKTGNLWAPWTAHTINNSVLNLVHIRTPAGLDGEVMVLYLIIVFGLIPLMLLIKLLAGRLGLPELRPWGEAEADQ